MKKMQKKTLTNWISTTKLTHIVTKKEGRHELGTRLQRYIAFTSPDSTLLSSASSFVKGLLVGVPYR